MQTTPNIAKKVCISPLYPFRPYYPFRSSFSVSFPSDLIIRFVRPYLFPFLPSLFHIRFVRYRPLSRSLKADFIRSHRSSPLSPRRRPLTTGDRSLTGASPLVFHCRSAVQRQRRVICCWPSLGGLREKKVLQKLLPLCHQPSETAVFQVHAGWWQQGGRWQQSPTPNPSPKGRGAAAQGVGSSSCPVTHCENGVFLRRKQRFLA